MEESWVHGGGCRPALNPRRAAGPATAGVHLGTHLLPQAQLVLPPSANSTWQATTGAPVEGEYPTDRELTRSTAADASDAIEVGVDLWRTTVHGGGWHRHRADADVSLGAPFGARCGGESCLAIWGTPEGLGGPPVARMAPRTARLWLTPAWPRSRCTALQRLAGPWSPSRCRPISCGFP